MNTAAILTAIIMFLQALPKMIAAGVDIFETTERMVAVLKKVRDEKRDPAPEEWDTLHANLLLDEQALQTDDVPAVQAARAPDGAL